MCIEHVVPTDLFAFLGILNEFFFSVLHVLT